MNAEKNKPGCKIYQFKTYLSAYDAINRCKTKISSIQKEIEKIEETVKESRKNGGPLTEPSRRSQLIPNGVQITLPNGVTWYTGCENKIY